MYIGEEPNINTDILLWIEMEEAGAYCEVIGNIHDDNPENAKEYILANWFDGDDDVKAVTGGNDETMAMKAAVEALEKQIPKKLPVINELYHCPTCGEKDAVLQGDNYCFNCGQALDWSDTK